MRKSGKGSKKVKPKIVKPLGPDKRYKEIFSKAAGGRIK